MRERKETAESVTEGHPDKLADQISDAILDACLSQDENSRIAVEVMLTSGKVFIAGEITTGAEVDYVAVSKKIIINVGYNIEGLEFECRIHNQSADISTAVDGVESQGAGDQGIVYGYATCETKEMLPLAAVLANALTSRLTECRKKNIIAGLMPDGKSQVTVEKINGHFDYIHTVLVSAQHTEDKDVELLKKEIQLEVIEFVLSKYDLDNTNILINPSGKFVMGGFEADTGLTGRKLMVDSYGGLARHGGGAFSGKDPSKVDRSGAYFARYVAKNIIAAGFAEECEVSIAYAIGKAEALAVDIKTFNTALISEEIIKKIVLKVFDFTPASVIGKLDLKRANYSATSVGGHFGGKDFAWEQLNDVKTLSDVAYERSTDFS